MYQTHFKLKGFTLSELLVVMVLSTITISIVMSFISISEHWTIDFINQEQNILNHSRSIQNIETYLLTATEVELDNNIILIKNRRSKDIKIMIENKNVVFSIDQHIVSQGLLASSIEIKGFRRHHIVNKGLIDELQVIFNQNKIESKVFKFYCPI